MAADNCRDCKHFDPHEKADLDKDAHLGRCKRFPPQNGSKFPQVQADESCGEFKSDADKIKANADRAEANEAKRVQKERLAFSATDCCRRFSPGENHAPGCVNDPAYVPPAPEKPCMCEDPTDQGMTHLKDAPCFTTPAPEPVPLSDQAGEAVARIVDQNPAPEAENQEK